MVTTKSIVILFLVTTLCSVYSTAAPGTIEGESPLITEKDVDDMKEAGRQLVEQGRTFVHHAVKRMMVLVPAIFFKLGIAFTMLVIVTIVAVNNGFIGFLLLVVGLSSVLARLQEARKPATVPLINPLPPYHHHYIDRSDNDADKTQTVESPVTIGPYGGSLAYQQYQPSNVGGYYSKYANN